MVMRAPKTLARSSTVNAPDIHRVRYELKRRLLNVQRVEHLTPNMVRVTVGGDELSGFTSQGFDDHVKLFFTDTTGQTVRRDFTPRRYDASRAELLIDFALHESGPATHWASTAAKGMTLALGGPRGSSIIPTDLDSHLLIGDETALPAIGRRLDELPSTTRAWVVAEIGNESERQAFSTAANVEVIWVYRRGAAPGSADALLKALRIISVPTTGCFAWIAGESNVARRLRQFLVEERRVEKSWVKAAGYWRRGAVGAHDRIDD
jgi:NADPH-dependent ferric siderophore reductase